MRASGTCSASRSSTGWVTSSPSGGTGVLSFSVMMIDLLEAIRTPVRDAPSVHATTATGAVQGATPTPPDLVGAALGERSEVQPGSLARAAGFGHRVHVLLPQQHVRRAAELDLGP